jgi:hypothetical protein
MNEDKRMEKDKVARDILSDITVHMKYARQSKVKQSHLEKNTTN